jgi:hypothetical protein
MPNFREFSFCSGQGSSPIHSGPLLCLVGKTIGDTRRTKVTRNVGDEAAAGAAARVTCDVSTLRGTYLFADQGVDVSGIRRVPIAGAGYEYFDGTGNIEGILTSNIGGTITSRDSYDDAKYTVNPDCTGRSTYPATRTTPEYQYDLYIHPEGDMFTWVQIKPRGSEVVSAVEQRVTLKRLGG